MNKIQQYKAAEELANALRDEVCREYTVLELVENGLHVCAIKKYRDVTGCSLVHARDYIKTLRHPETLGTLLRKKLNAA